MHITFIQAGGTIDKDYPRSETDHGYEFQIADPAVKNILPNSHVLFSYTVEEVLKKDSLDMNDTDRQTLVEAVHKATDHVVITHGTDTIFKTANAIAEHVSSKTIVLTGAMLPEKFTTSDARFNVGMAAAAVQSLTPGVYIALYGRVVPYMGFPNLAKEFEDKTKKVQTTGYDKEQ